MTDDELAQRGRALEYRAEALRQARERATTPDEHATLDAVEEYLREDVRRHKAAVDLADLQDADEGGT